MTMYMISAGQETECRFFQTSLKGKVVLPWFIQRTAKGVGRFLGSAKEKGDKSNDAFHRGRVDFEIFFVPVWHLCVAHLEWTAIVK